MILYQTNASRQQPPQLNTSNSHSTIHHFKILNPPNMFIHHYINKENNWIFFSCLGLSSLIVDPRFDYSRIWPISSTLKQNWKEKIKIKLVQLSKNLFAPLFLCIPFISLLLLPLSQIPILGFPIFFSLRIWAYFRYSPNILFVILFFSCFSGRTLSCAVHSFTLQLPVIIFLILFCCIWRFTVEL